MFVSVGSIIVLVVLSAFYFWALNRTVKIQSETIKEERERANAYEAAAEELSFMIVNHREAIERIDDDAFDLALKVQTSNNHAEIEEAAATYRTFKLIY